MLETFLVCHFFYWCISLFLCIFYACDSPFHLFILLVMLVHVVPVLIPRVFTSSVASICVFLIAYFHFQGLTSFSFFLHLLDYISLYFFVCFFFKDRNHCDKMGFKAIILLFRYFRISTAFCSTRAGFRWWHMHWLLLIMILCLPFVICLSLVLVFLAFCSSSRDQVLFVLCGLP